MESCICINGKKYVFENAYGYWEGDCGRSFPKKYAWTHSFLEGKDGAIEGSLMLSVAEIPLAGLCFTGIIGIVLWKGKEYRFRQNGVTQFVFETDKASFEYEY